MRESNDLIVGAWRNGLADSSALERVEKRRLQGFRQFPYESTVAELADLLDLYDEFVVELLELKKTDGVVKPKITYAREAPPDEAS